MSKFTQGEWLGGEGYIFLPNGKNYQANGFEPDEELQANARLIAAAPSMYTLLSKLLYHDDIDAWAVDEIEKLFAEIDWGD